jgi:hypothetical protein
MRPPFCRPALAVALAAALGAAATAGAQLPAPATAPPDPVSAVTSVVGGVVTTTTQAVTGTVDQVLGGAPGATLPAATLDQLLGAGGASSTTASGGTSTSGTTVDVRAPKARVTLLSRLRTVGRSGRLRLRISLDEQGIVAMRGTLRPGLRRRLPRALARRRYSRRAVRIPTTVLAYRRPGALTVTIVVSRTAQRMLGRARDARLDLRLLAADLARNQAASRVLRHVPR